MRHWLAAFWLISIVPPGISQTTEVHSFANLNRVLPDGNAAGLSEVRSINSTVAAISAVKLKLRIDGEFNGDLYGYLRHIRSGETNYCVLLNRPGRSAAKTVGYADAGLNVTFQQTAADVHLYRSFTNLPPAMPLNGVWQPDGRAVDPGVVLETSPRTGSLDSFNSIGASGEWTLFLADMESGGTNMLVSWELEITGPTVPSITWPIPADIVYGTPLGPTQLNASSPASGTFVYNPPTGTMLNAGNGRTLSVTFFPPISTRTPLAPPM